MAEPKIRPASWRNIEEAREGFKAEILGGELVGCRFAVSAAVRSAVELNRRGLFPFASVPFTAPG